VFLRVSLFFSSEELMFCLYPALCLGKLSGDFPRAPPPEGALGSGKVTSAPFPPFFENALWFLLFWSIDREWVCLLHFQEARSRRNFFSLFLWYIPYDAGFPLCAVSLFRCLTKDVWNSSPSTKFGVYVELPHTRVFTFPSTSASPFRTFYLWRLSFLFSPCFV